VDEVYDQLLLAEKALRGVLASERARIKLTERMVGGGGEGAAAEVGASDGPGCGGGGDAAGGGGGMGGGGGKAAKKKKKKQKQREQQQLQQLQQQVQPEQQNPDQQENPQQEEEAGEEVEGKEGVWDIERDDVWWVFVHSLDVKGLKESELGRSLWVWTWYVNLLLYQKQPSYSLQALVPSPSSLLDPSKEYWAVFFKRWGWENVKDTLLLIRDDLMWLEIARGEEGWIEEKGEEDEQEGAWWDDDEEKRYVQCRNRYLSTSTRQYFWLDAA